MIELTLTGHLGADVTLEGGFCRLRLAVNQTRVIEGEKVEETIWVSVFATSERLKGLVPYLKKGAKLFVQGRPKFGCYSSPTLKRFVPDVSLWASTIEVLVWPDKPGEKEGEKSENSNEPF